jgi:hypothetical protein
MNAETKPVVVFCRSPIVTTGLLRQRIWPVAIIAFGLVLTVGWTGLLGYGLFELVRTAL